MSLRVRAGAAERHFCTCAGAAASVGFDLNLKARARRPPLGPWQVSGSSAFPAQAQVVGPGARLGRRRG